MPTPSYGYDSKLKSRSLEAARALVTEALAAEGFGVLTEIDVEATLRNKLDIEFRPYVILGACHPTLAHRALGAEPQIGLLLPCNVVLQELDGEVSVSIASPRAMFGLVDNRQLEPVVAEAEERISRVVAALAASG